MTEGEKRLLYYDLRTYDVQVEEDKTYGFRHSISYTFGRFCITNWWDYVNIRYKRNIIGEWDDDDSMNHEVYKILKAVQNKVNGKQYDDPYKDISADAEIKKLTKSFGKEILKKADEILPPDMSKYEILRSIVKMKQFLAQNLQEHYKSR